jgi:hypothetical protein
MKPEDFQRVWNYYSRSSVQKAILEVAKDREVVCVFPDGRFGKRPDMLQYQSDILQAVAEGAVAFHGSVERWSQPMKLDVGMTKQELDALRKGWDIIIDPDVKDFEIAKIATKQIIEALKDHGVKNYSVKFTGHKGFHIGIPFESLPETINFQPTSSLFPELFQKIIEYIKWYIRDSLREELLSFENPTNISQRIGKPLSEIVDENGLNPFKIVAIDVFSSRHLFRLPYSLHESSLLVSLPINPEKIEKFEREDALPEKVKIEETFLTQKTSLRDAEGLVVEALDWASKYQKEVAEALPPKKLPKTKFISEMFFPPCITTILQGLKDGRKRSVFILINFLRNMGWDMQKIEEKVFEWNEKNVPPLRKSYVRSQLRWHFRQDKNLLPPNCDNQNFYSDIGICSPDEICKTGIKNPVNYPFKKIKKRKFK